jgi:hypothetical protein
MVADFNDCAEVEAGRPKGNTQVIIRQEFALETAKWQKLDTPICPTYHQRCLRLSLREQSRQVCLANVFSLAG